MNRLEEYICNHKSLFDEEPATGHFERLQQKMNRKSMKTIVLRCSLSVAASIAVICSAGMIWQYAAKQNELNCENAADMKICYLNRMNIVVNQIEGLIKDFEPWDQQEVMNEVYYIIDAVNNDLDIDLPEELHEDRAREILADYYQHNLEGLEMIVELVTN